MPRIHGYRERRYANMYDALRVTEMTPWERLFGNRNIGNQQLTNMYVAGQLGQDATFVIANVYTRTNLSKPRPLLDDNTHKEVRRLFAEGHEGDAIGTLMRDLRWERTPLTRALEEWAHTAVVEVIIGCQPQFSMNFYDLMDGPALGPGRASGQPLAESEQPYGGAQSAWRKAIARPMIVPVRQNISVSISSSGAATNALKHIAKECGVLPEPLVWVHLEGLVTRDVG